MSAVAAPLARARLAVGARQRLALGLVALLGLSLVLRSTALHTRYWIDEGLAVGIARHPLSDIPSLLRQDGSPPLYYLLLGVWVRLFGIGEARTHALSLGFALLTVPLAYAAARALFDRRAAWLAAGVAALNPFVGYYAQETRMYALVVLLSLAMAACWALAFAQGRRRWLWGFVLTGTALAYTHNWGLFVIAGSAAALLPRLVDGSVARRDAMVAYGGIGLLYLPWLPTLAEQAAHTAAPWSRAPGLVHVPSTVARIAGGPGPGMAILLGAGAGLAAVLTRGARRPRPAAEVAAARGIATMLGAALALAFLSSLLSPAWTARYFAALVGPAILLVGLGLARAGRLGVVVALLLGALWLHPPGAQENAKSNVHAVAVESRGLIRPGDIVVSTHPEQVPVAHLYFPSGLRWGSGLGWFPDTGIMDWRDVVERYKNARPTPVADMFVRALRPGQQLVLMQPILRSAGWKAPWTKLVKRRTKQWERVLEHDRRLERVAAIPHVGQRRRPPDGVRVVLFRRVR